MQDDIRAQVQRVLQIWGGEGIVDAKQDILLPGETRQCCNVDDIHQWIGRRLGPYQFRIGIEVRADGFGVLHVDEMEADTRLLEYFGEKPVGAPIHVTRSDDLIAGYE